MQHCCKIKYPFYICNKVAIILAIGIMRNTKSVRIILNTFDHSHGALSRVELYDRLHREMNKTTVYRILQRLEDHGRLHSFMGRDGRKWYAKCSDKSSQHHQHLHPHFQCKKCGKIECLQFEIEIPVLPHHKIDAAEFLLFGQCEDCYS